MQRLMADPVVPVLRVHSLEIGNYSAEVPDECQGFRKSSIYATILGMGGESKRRLPRIERAQILTAYRAGPETAIEELEGRIQELEQRGKQDSHNGSKPPCSDGPAHRPYVKREKSMRKPGGQPGHEGTTLQRVTALPISS
jgi:hypothetical protein